MKDLCSPQALSSRKSEVENDKVLFDTLITKALQCIKKAKCFHDELESYYIKAMDFSVVDDIYKDTLKKIEKYTK